MRKKSKSSTAAFNEAIDPAEQSGMNDPEAIRRNRRIFSPEYKLGILQEIDACKGYGEIEAVLKREGLYSSNINLWRRQRDQSYLKTLMETKRGRKTKSSLQSTDIRQIRRDNTRLSRKLKQADQVVNAQRRLLVKLRSLLKPKQRQQFAHDVLSLTRKMPTKTACAALGTPPSSFYKFLKKLNNN